MDKRINYKLVIDTETCPLDKDFEGVSGYNMLAYDIGYAIVDKRGKVYLSRSFVCANVFIGEKGLMKSAYYAKKIPQYQKDLANHERKLATLATIRATMIADMRAYNVKQVYAHNMRFDYATLNNTQRYITKSKYRYFFPYGVEICDTLKMARQVIGTMATYKKFCHENGYLTKRGACKHTAEVIYRFLTGDTAFDESHTALEDVMIEKDILAYCYARHKKMNRLCWG